MSDVNVYAAPQNVKRKFTPGSTLGVTDEEKARARAVPIAGVVGAVVPLNARGWGLCPFHEERTPSFHVHTRRNIWKCFGCGAGGDTIAFIQAARKLDFSAAVRLLAGRALEWSPRAARVSPLGSGPSSPQDGRLISPASIPAAVEKLWGQADASRLAELYLYSRGIRVRPKPLPDALRGHRRVWCTESHEERPAVLAALSAPDGAITALQRIWVNKILLVDSGISPPKGTRATDLQAGKKTIGSMGAGAVRLAEPGSILGIAEGVETALSASQIYSVPCWAALGAQRMGAIELPELVKQVIVFGDNGAAGEKAAASAVSAYRRRGYQAEAVFPERGGDFNEMLVAK